MVVSWASLPLPSGVQLREYVVHYKQTTLDTVSSTEFITTTMAGNYSIIEGLSSGANYEFWVEAVIQEIDGTLQTGDVLSAGNVTLFIPGILLYSHIKNGVLIHAYRCCDRSIKRWTFQTMSWLDCKFKLGKSKPQQLPSNYVTSMVGITIPRASQLTRQALRELP